jgi:histidinol-phosphate/aromatic aminotransferase/cobyric acid decarboxylase-like protein
MGKLKGKVGMVFPTFEEYPNRYETSETEIYIPNNPDFKYSVSDLINHFDKTIIKTLLLINPDNPSGNYIPKSDVLILVKWCDKKKIRLILDESFVDFTNEFQNNSLLNNQILKDNPNLVVIKSISKTYGVPGLRLGGLMSSDIELVNEVKKDVAIWNINSFAEFYMQIFGKYESDYKEACNLFINERERFYNDLLQISWLRVIPSQANYFLCEVLSKFNSTELMRVLLIKHNILIKDCSTKVGFENQNYIRIAVRGKIDNEKLFNELREL